MRYLISVLTILSVLGIFADNTSATTTKPPTPAYTMQEMQNIADSILMEGNLLALYERAAWIAGDLFNTKDRETVAKFGGYIVYHDEDDNVKVVFSDGTQDELTCIYEVIFYDDPENPMSDSVAGRKFTEYEEILWTTRDKIIGQFEKVEAEVVSYENFSLNHIIFPIHSGYRLYFISGTTLNGIFPFGNDYFFDADIEGNIVYWRKMHSQLIPSPMEHEGNPTTEIVHSHLPAEPFITPTDICTFQIYAPYSKVKKLRILSTALQVYFTYDPAEDTITIENRLSTESTENL